MVGLGGTLLTCPRLRVFGRMTPHQKVFVVPKSNDSGALRAAHAGLALSARAEASAAAPFSTDSTSLFALVRLLREGRASLCTSSAAYRFLVVRGIVVTQAKNVMMLYAGLYMAPLAYPYLDMLSLSVLLWAICLARPAARLAPRVPEASLFGPQNVVSATLATVLYLATLGILIGFLFVQPWFVPFETDVALNEWQTRSDNFESPIFFLWNAWFALDLATVFSKGHLYRLKASKNKALVWSVILLALPCVLLLFSGETAFNCAFKINCDKWTFFRIKDHWINSFLFPYERIGGDTWSAPLDSTNYSIFFKILVAAILLLASLLHHYLHSTLILGPLVQEWMPRRLGWDDGRGRVFLVWAKAKQRALFSRRRPGGLREAGTVLRPLEARAEEEEEMEGGGSAVDTGR
ncbi:hypothetical protein T484DRAFT_1896321, partial [Baffinella frigidus]